MLVCLPPAPWQVSSLASVAAREKAGVGAGSLYANGQSFEVVRSYCTARKLPCCELLETFKRQPQPETLFLNHAAALSSVGHALYAQELARFVLQNATGPWNSSPASPASDELVPQAALRSP